MAHERKKTVIPRGRGNIACQQIDHSYPVARLNPARVKKAKNGGRVNEISVVEVVVVQSDVTAKSRGIPDQGAPITVVIKHTGALVVGGAVEPVLQLVLQARLETIQCCCV